MDRFLNIDWTQEKYLSITKFEFKFNIAGVSMIDKAGKWEVQFWDGRSLRNDQCFRCQRPSQLPDADLL